MPKSHISANRTTYSHPISNVVMKRVGPRLWNIINCKLKQIVFNIMQSQYNDLQSIRLQSVRVCCVNHVYY